MKEKIKKDWKKALGQPLIIGGAMPGGAVLAGAPLWFLFISVPVVLVGSYFYFKWG